MGVISVAVGLGMAGHELFITSPTLDPSHMLREGNRVCSMDRIEREAGPGLLIEEAQIRADRLTVTRRFENVPEATQELESSAGEVQAAPRRRRALRHTPIPPSEVDWARVPTMHREAHQAAELPKARLIAFQKKAQRPLAIPAPVRREVWERDGGRCSFVDDQGRQCNATRRVEFHHTVPFAKGGEHEPKNVELRCQAHNQHEAEVEYGKGFMNDKRRRRTSPTNVRERRSVYRQMPRNGTSTVRTDTIRVDIVHWRGSRPLTRRAINCKPQRDR